MADEVATVLIDVPSAQLVRSTELEQSSQTAVLTPGGGDFRVVVEQSVPACLLAPPRLLTPPLQLPSSEPGALSILVFVPLASAP